MKNTDDSIDDMMFDELEDDIKNEKDSEDSDFYESESSVVCGYYADEEPLETYNDRENYDNREIDDHLDVYFRLFGLKDMDIIYMYFLSQKRQQDIKDIAQKTQPAISYDVSRIKKQMDFVVEVISRMDEFVLFITDEKNGLNIQERELLLVFFYSTSIVKTSKILGFGQISCRVKILKTIDRLKELGHDSMYGLMTFVASNLNNIKKSISE